jgi:tetratricopeptide (TPR) repeat protein
MNAQQITDQTIEIYLQIATTACKSNNHDVAAQMLTAAFDHVHTVCAIPNATTLTNLAELLITCKRGAQAEEVYNLALRTYKISSSGNSKTSDSTRNDWLLARIYDGLSEIYASRFQFEKAKKKCEQAIKIMSLIPGFDLAIVSSRVRRLAMLNFQHGNKDKAAELLRQSNSMRYS